MHSHQEQIDVFNEYYPEIGRVIVAWAFLEFEVDKLLLALLYDPKASTLLNKTNIAPGKLLPYSLTQRLKLWKQLAKVHYTGDVHFTLNKIIKQCWAMKPTRDRLAHGTWAIDLANSGPIEIISQLPEHGRIADSKTLSLGEIKRLKEEIYLAQEQVRTFHRDHHPDGPLPKRLRAFFERLNQGSKSQG